MQHATRWAIPAVAALAAISLAACSDTTTSPVSAPTTPVFSNGFPDNGKATLYKMNVLGVPKGKTASMTGDNGKRMFVNLEGNSKIYLQEGPFDIIDANGTDANGATFQLPDPDPDGDGVTSYGVYVRPKGKPGGSAKLTSCMITDTGEELCSTETTIVVRGKGKPTVKNVSKDLLTVCLDTDGDGKCDLRSFLFDDKTAQYLWNWDNQGLKNAEVRFIEIPQNIGLTP